ncbi:hypothetical protein [Bradyrhizobium sp. 157]|uniref:hypothetical protein n=1 Tax=Bradyrhizobium sp. 157 TaxID=2782631 RepID=UPI001FF9C219|nr:hypothetical protein [Bradyrhizobium sp. 157]
MGRAIILNEKVDTACDVAGASRGEGESDEAPFVPEAMKHLPTQGRSATAWIAATMLAMTWASETQSSPDHARHLADAQHAMAARNFESHRIAGYGDFGSLPVGMRSDDKSVQVAQATTGDEGLPPEQKRHWTETLLFELTIARRDIELLQRLEQELDRAERQEQALAAARRDVEAQVALAQKASEEASRLKREGGTAEVQTSLRQERERSAQLEQDLAAARRDVEAQTALAAKAIQEVLQRKQAAEAGADELRQSIQKADALAHDLSMTRNAMYASEAEARRAGDEAAELRQAIANGEPSLCKSAQDEHDRSERLEQHLAAARREVDTQTALAAKASEEASRLKQVSESSEAELQKSLQQERERSARLEQDLVAARRDVETQTALAAKASEQASRLQQARGGNEAELQKSLQQERERSAQQEQNLAAARRDVETQTALAAKATEEVLRSKRAAEADAAELRQSMQKERKRADALAQDLSIARSATYAYEAQARKVGDEVAELRQAAANGALSLRNSAQDGRDRTTRLEEDLVTARRDLDAQAALAASASEEVARTRQAAERDSASLRSSLQQERARAEQLERDLALAKQVPSNAVTVGSIARNEPTENAKSIAESPAAGVRSDAQPNSKKAAVAALLARASALLGQGNIGSARIVLERAVEMGSVQASFSLAETYDPLILAKWGTIGTRGDAARAQDLYAKADAAGIKEAKARIEALRR